MEILKKFCPEGYEMAKKHGHFLVGKAMDGSYIGIPGRFLLKEQPAGGRTGFTLWQPLRGGEEMYGAPGYHFRRRSVTGIRILDSAGRRTDPETLRSLILYAKAVEL